MFAWEISLARDRLAASHQLPARARSPGVHAGWLLQDLFARYNIPTDIRKRTIDQFLSRHTNRRLMRDDMLLKDMAPSMRVGVGPGVWRRVEAHAWRAAGRCWLSCHERVQASPGHLAATAASARSQSHRP